MQKGDSAHFYCEMYFSCKENLVNYAFKTTERVLDPCVMEGIPSLKPVRLRINQNKYLILM